MKRQLISDDYDRPTATNQESFAIIFDDGDEVMAGLKKFAGEQRLGTSHFTASGWGYYPTGGLGLVVFIVLVLVLLGRI
jgi:Protein of unknown function (DUF3309)